MAETLNVLLIEDSEGDAFLVIRELQKGNFNPVWERVHRADSFETLLNTRDWDVIIADYYVPGFDAPEALERVKESQLDIPFIVVSGVMGEKVAVEMMKSGAHDYLMKDNLTRLPEAVRREVRETQVRSERKQTTKLLRRQQAGVEAAIDGIGILHGDTYLYVNQAQLNLFGYECPEDLVGKTWRHLYSPAEVERLEREVFPLLERERSWQGEMMATRNDGSTFIQGGTLTLNEDGLLISVSRDISDIKQAEVEIQLLNEGLEQRVIERTAQLEAMKEAAEIANRAKSQFLANMSHELRTPLNAILGFSQMMQREQGITAEQQENLSIINRSGEHLLQLINDVLTVSKIEAGCNTLKLKDCNLYHLCDGISEMLQRKVEEKGLQLQINIAPQTPKYIKADVIKLRQVLINVLGNAIKFTQSGIIKLHVTGDSTSLSTRTNRVHFEIQDTGPGIPEADLELLFDAFKQSKLGLNSSGGTGLGLTISKSFVQLMGGEMSLQSELGNGTTVRFDILVGEGTEAPCSPSVLSPVIGLATDQAAVRILVVEDHLDSRLLLVTLLKSIGFEVEEAENGQVAIELVETWQPDLIWMDLQMPVVNGLEVARHIKAKSNPPVILALTANAFEGDKTLALEAGCDGFVRKPVLENIILDKIAEFLDVKYLYADVNKVESLNVNPSPLSAIDLAVMPQRWLEELSNASLSLNEHDIEQLLQRIPPEYQSLKLKLSELVQTFSFHKIVELVKAGQESNTSRDFSVQSFTNPTHEQQRLVFEESREYSKGQK